MIGYNYCFVSRVPGRGESPGVLGEKFVRYLHDLEQIDDIFCGWEIVDKGVGDCVPLENAERNIETVIKNNVVCESGEPDPNSGYWMSAFNKYPLDSPNFIGIRILAGSIYSGGLVNSIDIGSTRAATNGSIVKYKIFRDVLLIIISVWTPLSISIKAFEVTVNKTRYTPGVPVALPRLTEPPTWMLYLSKPLAEGLNLPRDILAEPTPDGGLLIMATDEDLDLSNPEHLRRANIVTKIRLERAD